MKTFLISVVLSAFASFSFAGSVSSGSFNTTGFSVGHTNVSSTAKSIEIGAGSKSIRDGLAYRDEDYTKNNKTVVKRVGGHDTSSSYASAGVSANGTSIVETTGQSRISNGYVNVSANVDNLTEGTYEQGYQAFIFKIPTESGSFSESYVANESGYENYRSQTTYENSEMRTEY